jgi:hypothetical protein
LSAPETDPQAQRFTSIEKLLGEKYPDDWAIKLADVEESGAAARGQMTRLRLDCPRSPSDSAT